MDNIELLEAKIKTFGEIQELLVMLDNVTKTKILFAEVAHHNNPEELHRAKAKIFEESLIEVNKIKMIFAKVSGV